MIAESLDSFLADYGVVATYNGNDVMVILDKPDSNVLGNRVMSIGYKITFKSVDLGNMLYGEAITVDGDAYKVLETNSLDDGVFAEAVLEKV